MLSDDWQRSLPGPCPSTPAHLHQCQLPSLLPPSVQLRCRALKGRQKPVSVGADLETWVMTLQNTVRVAGGQLIQKNK